MITELHDTGTLADFFRRDPFLHLYALGDLDDFFRPHARWWGLFADQCAGAGGASGVLREVVLLYDAGNLPVVLAFTRDPDGMSELLIAIQNLLPARFYAHLSPGLEPTLASGFRLEPHGRHLRMGLIDDTRASRRGGATGELPDDTAAPDPGMTSTTGPFLLPRSDPAEFCVLSQSDLDDLLAFYATSYPGNWFDPRMLDTGQYVGLRLDGGLCAVAGVHVYSPAHRVAALGNIATRPEHRGRGLARAVTGALCRRLRERVDWIGLNVHAENGAAIACYRGLGFARITDYGEFMVNREG